MKSIFQTIIRASILTGALFFYSHSIQAAGDSLHTDNSVSNTESDSIVTESAAETSPGTHSKRVEKARDSIYTPTEKELKRRFADHSPHKATIYSAVLPGLGQAYNRKYWKIPIIYGAGAALYYGFGWLGFDEWGFKFFQEQYLIWNEKYQTEYYKPPGERNETNKDLYAKNVSIARKGRDRVVILMAILYAANIVDAMADAHFYYFDISDDLSMKIVPSLITPDPIVAYTDYTVGVKLRFKF